MYNMCMYTVHVQYINVHVHVHEEKVSCAIIFPKAKYMQSLNGHCGILLGHIHGVSEYCVPHCKPPTQWVGWLLC